MTVKTDISRFHIHDELTAPKASAPILKGALSSSGKLNNFVGVLSGSLAELFHLDESAAPEAPTVEAGDATPLHVELAALRAELQA